jgi:hypothetical protein
MAGDDARLWTDRSWLQGVQYRTDANLAALAGEVRELRRRLGRNSGNSSMAPSADDLPGRTPPPAMRA